MSVGGICAVAFVSCRYLHTTGVQWWVNGVGVVVSCITLHTKDMD